MKFFGFADQDHARFPVPTAGVQDDGGESLTSMLGLFSAGTTRPRLRPKLQPHIHSDGGVPAMT
jgi:hypothetical protein